MLFETLEVQYLWELFSKASARSSLSFSCYHVKRGLRRASLMAILVLVQVFCVLIYLQLSSAMADHLPTRRPVPTGIEKRRTGPICVPQLGYPTQSDCYSAFLSMPIDGDLNRATWFIAPQGTPGADWTTPAIWHSTRIPRELSSAAH